MVGRNADYYEAHSPTVNLENVTSSDENAIILQKLRDNDPNLTCLWIEQDIDDDVSCEFVVREGDDLGWLGYFLGGSTTLTELHIYYLPQEKWRIIAFIRELVSNRSIQKLAVSTNLGDGFHSLGTLLKSDTLVTLEFNSYGQNFDIIELQCARDIALMLGHPNQRNHLTSLVFEEIHISGEAMAEIAAALSAHPQLEMLDLYWDTPPGGRQGSVALGRLLGGWKKPALKELILWNDVFDGEGLHELVAGMRNCRNLNKLSLAWNSITANGCRSLSTLQFDNCCLEHLRLNIYNVDGYCAAALATGLVNLCSLKSLSLSCSSFHDGLSALAPAIASLRLLETLSFAHNSIGNDGVRAIAGELVNLHFLDVLDLSYSSIGNEGAGALVAGLTGLRSLKKLDLSGNPIGNEGATILAPAIGSLRLLETLNVMMGSLP